MAARLIDVSHTIEHGQVTYKGLPPPLISDHLTREASRAIYTPGTEFYIGRIEMVANTGTYVDSPFHRYAHGKDLTGAPISISMAIRISPASSATSRRYLSAVADSSQCPSK
jgi:arylformamidase